MEGVLVVCGGGGGMLEGKMFGVGENVYERISHQGGDRNV